MKTEVFINLFECRYWGMCRICYGTDCDGVNGTCKRYEPMPDVDALKALASMLDDIGVGCVITRDGAKSVSLNIRKALGVEP